MMKLEVPHLLPAMVLRPTPLYAVSTALKCLSGLKYLTCLSSTTLVCITMVSGLKRGWVNYIGGGSETVGRGCAGATYGAAFRVLSLRSVIWK